MRLFTTVLLSCCLLLQACCSADGPRHRHRCLSHPEPPFDISGRPPGPGLVFGTADFDSNGSVLIKIQVEDLAGYPGDEATVTAWSGNGDAPANASVVPPVGGTQVYHSENDVHLRHWTTHLDRNYDPDDDKYWLFVRVDHDTGGGARVIKYLRWEWPSGSQSELDLPHDFLQY